MSDIEGMSSPENQYVVDGSDGLVAITSLQNVGTTQKIIATKRRSFISKRQSDLSEGKPPEQLNIILKQDDNDEAEEQEDADLD